jgi:hypothetical protein
MSEIHKLLDGILKDPHGVTGIQEYTDAIIELKDEIAAQNEGERLRREQDQFRIDQENARIRQESIRLSHAAEQIEVDRKQTQRIEHLINLLEKLSDEYNEIHHQPIMGALMDVKYDILLILQALYWMLPIIAQVAASDQQAKKIERLLEQAIRSHRLSMQVGGNSVGDVGGDLSGAVGGDLSGNVAGGNIA